MTGFPLLRLPLQPLNSALDMMKLDELVCVLLCSKKTGELLKTFKKPVAIDSLSNYQKSKLNAMEIITLLQLKAQNNPRELFGCFPEIELTIMISDKLKIQIDNPYSCKSSYNDCFPFSIEVMPNNDISGFAGAKSDLKIDNISVPVKIMDKRTMLTFWKYPYIGFHTLLAYFKKFFNTKIFQCSINGSRNPKFSRNLRAALALGKQTIDNCELKYDFDDEDYKFILDNIKPTVCFKQSNYTGKLNGNFRHKTSFNLVSLELGQANWFTLDNLVKTNCKYITLFESILTNDDMCEYLKLWMNGKFEKLRNLIVELQEHVNLEYISLKLGSYLQRYTFVQDSDIIRIKQLGKRDANFIGSAKIIRFNIL